MPQPGTATLADIITGYGEQKGRAAEAQLRPQVIAENLKQERIKTQQELQAQREQQAYAQIMRGIYADAALAQQKAAVAPSRTSTGLINSSGVTLDGVPSLGAAPANGQAPAVTAGPDPIDLLADPRAIATQVMRAGGNPRMVQDAYATATKLGHEYATMDKSTLDDKKEKQAFLANSLDGYLSNPTPEALAVLKSQAAKYDPEIAAELNSLGPAPTADKLAHIKGVLGLDERLMKRAEAAQDMANKGRAADDTHLAAGDTRLAASDTHTDKEIQRPALQAKAATDAAIATATLKDEALLSPEQRQTAYREEARAARDARRDANTERHERVMEGLSAEQNAIHRANAEKAKLPKTAPVAIVKGVLSNDQFIGNIDAAIDALKKNPDAVGMKNYAPAGLVNRVSPSGTDARALIAGIGGQKFHDLSGAAVSASEAARLKPFIPLLTDDKATTEKKLANLKAEAVAQNEALREAYSEDSGYAPIPSGSRKPAANAGPAAGTVESGYRFKGGNPAEKANWEKVQ